MDRMGRLFAALRALLVATTMCLFVGAGFAASAGPQPAIERSGSTHAQTCDAPEPGPAVAERRDEDPSGGPEHDGLAHAARTSLAPLSLAARRLRTIRGPPSALRSASWRPRSARGPPVPA